MAEYDADGLMDDVRQHVFVKQITKVVREADEEYEKGGGSTRHWVRDHFLPALDAAGFRIVTSPTHASPEDVAEQGDSQ